MHGSLMQFGSEEVHQQAVPPVPVRGALVGAHDPDRAEADALVGPDGAFVRRGGIDGQPVVAAIVDEMPPSEASQAA
jgi:hypothetical protein